MFCSKLICIFFCSSFPKQRVTKAFLYLCSRGKFVWKLPKQSCLKTMFFPYSSFQHLNCRHYLKSYWKEREAFRVRKRRVWKQKDDKNYDSEPQFFEMSKKRQDLRKTWLNLTCCKADLSCQVSSKIPLNALVIKTESFKFRDSLNPNKGNTNGDQGVYKSGGLTIILCSSPNCGNWVQSRKENQSFQWLNYLYTWHDGSRD